MVSEAGPDHPVLSVSEVPGPTDHTLVFHTWLAQRTLSALVLRLSAVFTLCLAYLCAPKL